MPQLHLLCPDDERRLSEHPSRSQWEPDPADLRCCYSDLPGINTARWSADRLTGMKVSRSLAALLIVLTCVVACQEDRYARAARCDRLVRSGDSCARWEPKEFVVQRCREEAPKEEREAIPLYRLDTSDYYDICIRRHLTACPSRIPLQECSENAEAFRKRCFGKSIDNWSTERQDEYRSCFYFLMEFRNGVAAGD